MNFDTSYVSLHNHTEFSNLRLLDSINKVEDLIQYAYDIGLKGVAITDHESLSGHIRALKYYNSKCKEDDKWQDFKLILGNEIYLCRNDLSSSTYEKGEKFPHFILLAKDLEGHHQLRELSSRAWSHSFTMFLTRVPTYYKDIEDIIKKNPGHIVASSACIGGWLGICQSKDDEQSATNFVKWCKDIFGEDFYLELQPARYEEQIKYNKWLLELSKKTHTKCIITTDSHYLRKEDREVHSSFLNSKDGDRETAEFYQYTYMMTPNEIYDYVNDYISNETLQELFDNTLEINNKISQYTLEKQQVVPHLKDDRNESDWEDWLTKIKIRDKFEYLNKYLTSQYSDDRYLLALALRKLNDLPLSAEARDAWLERLEGEATEMWLVSEQIGQPLSAYLLTVRTIVKTIWTETNSLVGVSRGSAGSLLFGYLIGMIDMNPMTCGLFLDYRRFVHREKPELSDVDLDSEGCRRNFIINKFDEVMRAQGGRSLNVATFGTLGTRSAILTAARGLGIDVDIAQYLATMIPQERGFNWSLKDCIYGNKEKDRHPVKPLIMEFKKYDNFLETALSIEGLVCQVGIHASGICFYDSDFNDYCCSMKAPNGLEITQWDLHDAEYAGSLKFDLLSVEALDKIHKCMDLLIEDGLMEWQGNLRSTYLKYLHPNVLDYDNPKMWQLLADNQIIDAFQMDTAVAKQSAKVIHPTSIPELAAVNSLMRLMPEKGNKTPVEEYVIYKQHPDLLKKEIDALEGDEHQKEVLYNFLQTYNGVPSSQESVMYLSMIPELTNFTFGEANKLRKLIAKKQMNKIMEFRKFFMEKGKENNVSDSILSFVWDKQIKRQLGYSFSDIHTIAYSLIALQEMNLNVQYPPIYWATACLTINSGGADEESGGTTNYGKLSSAIGRIKKQGIGVGLPNINVAKFGFTPNITDNTIIYGLKGISGVGDDLTTKIISERPYLSVNDFIERVNPPKSQMIALIKAGCFDKLEQNNNRKELLYNYICSLCPKKTKLTLANVNGLINYDVLPKTKSHFIYLFNFNKYLKLYKKEDKYYIDERAYEYFSKNFDVGLLNNDKKGTYINVTTWDKLYKDKMLELKEYINKYQNSLIDKLHEKEVQEVWEKSCTGTLSSWEMETLGFYYHPHELIDTYYPSFEFVDFYKESEILIPKEYKEIKGRQVPIYEIKHIYGTVLDKSSYKHTIILLTPNGVVNVKCVGEQYSKYDKQLSQLDNETGEKKVIERSWFKRGSKLIVSGYRSGDQFMARGRQSENIYPFYRILSVDDCGLLNITRYRADD